MSSASSRSSRTSFDSALDAAAEKILDGVGGMRAPTVLVDGRSGAGKTTLAARIAASWRGPIDLVALDDLYPGWDGLDAGVDEVLVHVLRPRRSGASAGWRGWDWAAGRPAGRHPVAGDRPLIVEGAGILTPATAELADLRVWLESPAGSRRSRALARDGDRYRPHWDRWAAQEDRHLERDRPESLADLVVQVP